MLGKVKENILDNNNDFGRIKWGIISFELVPSLLGLVWINTRLNGLHTKHIVEESALKEWVELIKNSQLIHLVVFAVESISRCRILLKSYILENVREEYDCDLSPPEILGLVQRVETVIVNSCYKVSWQHLYNAGENA